MTASSTFRRRRRFVILALVAALCFVGALELHRHARAAATLVRFSGAGPEALASYGQHQVAVEERQLAGRRLRTYRPRDETMGHLVIAHGMHPGGYDEPRLIALARAFAASGVVVHTPNQPRLAAFSLDPRTASELTETVLAISDEEGVGPLGVMGISFAGGLALVAASEAPSAFAFVVPVGAHHDLSRVVRWFAGDEALGPAGEEVHHLPHAYGVGLLVHADPARFFPPAEAELAARALSSALHERPAEADERSLGLSPESLRVLAEARHPSWPTPLADGLRSLLTDRATTFDEASPRGRLAGLAVPVMILHGAADPIVPPTEALYLAEELPGSTVLVSEALLHAETADSGWQETFALVHFVAEVLSAIETP